MKPNAHYHNPVTINDVFSRIRACPRYTPATIRPCAKTIRPHSNSTRRGEIECPLSESGDNKSFLQTRCESGHNQSSPKGGVLTPYKFPMIHIVGHGRCTPHPLTAEVVRGASSTYKSVVSKPTGARCSNFGSGLCYIACPFIAV